VFSVLSSVAKAGSAGLFGVSGDPPTAIDPILVVVRRLDPISLSLDGRNSHVDYGRSREYARSN
jgi:hypothetical protein